MIRTLIWIITICALAWMKARQSDRLICISLFFYQIWEISSYKIFSLKYICRISGNLEFAKCQKQISLFDILIFKLLKYRKRSINKYIFWIMHYNLILIYICIMFTLKINWLFACFFSVFILTLMQIHIINGVLSKYLNRISYKKT